MKQFVGVAVNVDTGREELVTVDGRLLVVAEEDCLSMAAIRWLELPPERIDGKQWLMKGRQR